MRNLKILVLALIVAFAIGSLIAFGARGSAKDEKPCVAQPSQEIGVAALSEGVGFIMAGGVGPILMLVIAFIIGMLVSHYMWSTF